MTTVIKFKPRTSVGAPTWVFVLSNAALLDEWNRVEGQDDTVRFNIISDEIGRREDAGTWTEEDWSQGGNDGAMTISATTQAGRHPLKDRAGDLYETPTEATLALLRAEKLPHRLWEPACGRGAIVNVLRAAGHEVVATDLVNYGEPITPPGHYGIDFLMEHKAPEGCECIVTNPPYKLAEQFVAHALDLCPRVYMLLRFTFFESERRRRILEGCGLARVHVFRNRLPMMHRDGWAGPKASSAVAYAWFCWSRDHTGPTELHRISWKPSAADSAHNGG
jgi:hypothetical protein